MYQWKQVSKWMRIQKEFLTIVAIGDFGIVALCRAFATWQSHKWKIMFHCLAYWLPWTYTVVPTRPSAYCLEYLPFHCTAQCWVLSIFVRSTIIISISNKHEVTLTAFEKKIHAPHTFLPSTFIDFLDFFHPQRKFTQQRNSSGQKCQQEFVKSVH